MNEITCDLCMDLIPLVKDGIASEDSRRAVEQHIEACGACRALYGGERPPRGNAEQAFARLRQKMQLFSAMLMMFGIFFGMGLAAGTEVFYNSLIMPFIGALGYAIFRARALYAMPLLLLATRVLLNIVDLVRGSEYLDLGLLLLWTAIYSFFALVGVAIAALLHFAFKKES